MMELRHLRYFVAVAEELHFGRAAIRLAMSQPPLSTQIRDLEREVGVALLDRTSRRVSLTTAGEAFLIEARRVLDAAERALRVAARSAEGVTGTVSLGFLGAAGTSIVPDALIALRQRAPEASLRVREFTSGPLLVDALTRSTIDIALLRPPIDPPGLHTESIATEPFVAILPRDHRLARRRSVALADMLEEPFVLWDRSASPQVFDPVFAVSGGIGEPANVTVHAVGIPSIVGMVAAGLGVSLLPASAVRRFASDVAIRPLRPPVPTIHQMVAWRLGDLSALGQRLVDELRRAAAHLPTDW